MTNQAVFQVTKSIIEQDFTSAYVDGQSKQEARLTLTAKLHKYNRCDFH